jgi:hypothetical protein
MPQPNALRLVVWITLSSSLLSALFAYVENRPIADFVNTELHGVLAGGLNGGILSSFEILVLRARTERPSANCRFYPISRSARFSTRRDSTSTLAVRDLIDLAHGIGRLRARMLPSHSWVPPL